MQGPATGHTVPMLIGTFVLLSSLAAAQSFIPRGTVIITHLSPDYGSSSDEFVVLYNASPDTVDLAGYDVRYFTASGSAGSAGQSFITSTLVPPHRHFLMASRETVVVGSAVSLRDAPFTSGMAATGGQLLLRKTGEPDSIVFAAAWGSVTNYLAGMTDAAAWSGDGMLGLTWSDTAYLRTSYNFSNQQYSHTTSSSIVVVPSLHPYQPPLPPVAWRITFELRQGGSSDTSLVAGMDSAALDGFDTLFDLPAPPAPAGGSLFARIDRSDLGLATGNHLLRDIRELRSLTDTSSRWTIDIVPGTAGAPVELMLFLSGLPAHLPVHIRDLQTGSLIDRHGDSLAHSWTPETTEPYSFELSIGDSTPPHVHFVVPAAGTSYTVGRTILIKPMATDGSGVDSTVVTFEDLAGPTALTVAILADTVSEFEWTLPRRLLSDSVQLRIEAWDAVGNYAQATSGVFALSPDTVRRSFVAGWHLFSTPIEPLDPAWNMVTSATPADSVFVFEYSRMGGYRPADSLIPGRGYFVGMMSDRSITIAGRPASDTVVVPLKEGFSLISNPYPEVISPEVLEFIRDGIGRSYAEAIASAMVGAGIFGYDPLGESYVLADSLRPWEGYWIPVLGSGVGVRVATITGGQSLRRRDASRGGWTLRLFLGTEDRIDSLLIVGVDPSATDGFDPAFDIAAPPPPPTAGRLRASIDHSEWDVPTGADFLTDIRGEGGGQTWAISLRSGRAYVARIWWKVGRGILPDDLRLEDPTTGTQVFLKGEPEYRLSLSGERLLLIHSSPTGVSTGESLPDRFEVGQNYPNPFNPTTEIAVEIPAAGWISVKIFDVLGREIALLADKHATPGRHIYRWMANVRSGPYLCRIEYNSSNGNEVRVRKLLLIR